MTNEKEKDCGSLAATEGAPACPTVPAPEQDAIGSIDGVNYRIEVINGVPFIEPGHDRITQSTTFADSILYFSERSCYRVTIPTPLTVTP